MGIERAFGLAVLDLLTRFNLADAQVAEGYFANNPNTYKDSWATTLTRYRGASLHQGYFEIQDAEDLHKTHQVLQHLHDILVRLIFKMLKYEGPYQPLTMSLTASEPVDRVKADTRPDHLGYILPS